MRGAWLTWTLVMSPKLSVASREIQRPPCQLFKSKWVIAPSFVTVSAAKAGFGGLTNPNEILMIFT